jgi:hypothetical protein
LASEALEVQIYHIGTPHVAEFQVPFGTVPFFNRLLSQQDRKCFCAREKIWSVIQFHSQTAQLRLCRFCHEAIHCR